MKKIGFLFLFCVFLTQCKKKNEPLEDCLCIEIYAPVCAGGQQYSNVCKAQCDGFTENEIIPIEIPEEGMIVEVNCSLPAT